MDALHFYVNRAIKRAYRYCGGIIHLQAECFRPARGYERPFDVRRRLAGELVLTGVPAPAAAAAALVMDGGAAGFAVNTQGL